MDYLDKLEEVHGERFFTDLLTKKQIEKLPWTFSWPIYLHSSHLKAKVPKFAGLEIMQQTDGYVRVYMHPPHIDDSTELDTEYIDEQGYPGTSKEHDLYALGNGLHQGLPYTFYVPNDCNPSRQEDLGGKEPDQFYIMSIEPRAGSQNVEISIRQGTIADRGPIKRLFPKPGETEYFGQEKQEISDVDDDSDAEMSTMGGEIYADERDVEDSINEMERSGAEEADTNGGEEDDDLDEQNNEDGDGEDEDGDVEENGVQGDVVEGDEAEDDEDDYGQPTPAANPTTTAPGRRRRGGRVLLGCPVPRCVRPEVPHSKDRRTDIVTHMVKTHGIHIPAELRVRGGHNTSKNQQNHQQNLLIQRWFAAQGLAPTNNRLY